MSLGKLIGVGLLGDRSLALCWDDAAVGEVALGPLIAAHERLAPLRDPLEFGSVALADDGWSIRFASGVDFGAEQLRRWAQEQGTLRSAGVAAE